MKVIIVGGGIGGLTTALMLHARGINCELYEQTETIRELGVGINTLPHAIKELAELGLLEALDAVGIRTYELFYTNRFGQEIWREPRGTDAGYEYPQFSIHRGRLQGVIHNAVRSRLGESRIHTGHRLGAFTEDDGGITAYFFDRHGSHRATARGDVLVVMDADLSHPPEIVPDLLAMIDAGVDLAVGSRYVSGGATLDWPLRRRVVSRVACLLGNALVPVRDATSGFFAVRRSAIDGVRLNAIGFKIGFEVIARANARRIVEVPYTFRDRELGASKFGRREIGQYLLQLGIVARDKVTGKLR